MAQEPCEKRAEPVVPSRGPRAAWSTHGVERETFIREVARALNCTTEQVDLAHDLWLDYRCDELHVLECLLIAEDIWNVTLVPSPYSSEVSDQVRRFRTLASILEAATRTAA